MPIGGEGRPQMLDQQLQRCANFKFYSALAKGCHLWRDNRKAVHEYLRTKGDLIAHASKTLVGRWDAGRLAHRLESKGIKITNGHAIDEI